MIIEMMFDPTDFVLSRPVGVNSANMAVDLGSEHQQRWPLPVDVIPLTGPNVHLDDVLLDLASFIHKSKNDIH